MVSTTGPSLPDIGMYSEAVDGGIIPVGGKSDIKKVFRHCRQSQLGFYSIKIQHCIKPKGTVPSYPAGSSSGFPMEE